MARRKKNQISYQIGDATEPIGDDNKIIAHICNDIGAWGAGFVLAISKKWSKPEIKYRQWHDCKLPGVNMELGAVQLLKVEEDIWVANMIGQHGIRKSKGIPPIRYDAVRECLQKVAERAQTLEASVHMPRIGAGLAGGDWAIIEKIIEEELVQKDIPTFVYDLPAKTKN